MTYKNRTLRNRVDKICCKIIWVCSEPSLPKPVQPFQVSPFYHFQLTLQRLKSWKFIILTNHSKFPPIAYHFFSSFLIKKASCFLGSEPHSKDSESFCFKLSKLSSIFIKIWFSKPSQPTMNDAGPLIYD